MPEQTLLAFDYGTKKIGVAIGNTLTRQARPLDILLPVTREQRFAAIAGLLAEWQPDAVVVGLPLAADGQEQYASLRCRRFANHVSAAASASRWCWWTSADPAWRPKACWARMRRTTRWRRPSSCSVISMRSSGLRYHHRGMGCRHDQS